MVSEGRACVRDGKAVGKGKEGAAGDGEAKRAESVWMEGGREVSRVGGGEGARPFVGERGG